MNRPVFFERFGFFFATGITSFSVPSVSPVAGVYACA